MPEITADKCDVCGKVVPKNWHADSTDMVHVEKSLLLLMCDIPDGKIGRPALQLGIGNSGGVFCLGCLVKCITDWANEVRKYIPSPSLTKLEEKK